MRFGLDFPPFGDLADPRLVAEIAADAEAAGWDAVFVWDHIMYREPVTDAGDPWIAMAAILTATEKVLTGPMVTPLARRRPHVVARQAASLDLLGGGRLVLGVGLGLDGSGRELSAFGEELDDRARAGMLDESLEVIDALWSGAQVRHSGTHYLVDDVRFLPRPQQRPRLPIWIAGRWPYKRPLRRAARWDGLFLIDERGPEDLAAAGEVVAAERGNLDGFAIVVNRPYGEAAGPWQEAGATWLLTESAYTIDADAVRAMARSGPVRDR
jgi:alkanesulfonate monooxygenase SsuD/methylene tetrahydromethanopterin reductase-like flavin-dependent oxidoreductase (luciferase family)